MKFDDDFYKAGRLIQFGLRPKESPSINQEYHSLLDEYINQSEFRNAVQAAAEGLGLQVLYASNFGFVVVPGEDSVFTATWSTYNASGKIVGDARLVTGLIHLAIMATVFPRPQDLTENFALARPSITVDEVESLLRRLSEAMEQKKKDEPDIAVTQELSGLYEAWRVYLEMPAAKGTKKGRTARNTTRKKIEDAFEFLQQQGCFKKGLQSNKEVFQPTWRYQLLVQEFSADQLYKEVRRILNPSK